MQGKTKAKINPLAKLAVDIGPLIVFFFTNAKAGIFWATGAFMVAIVIAVVVAWTVEKRLPILPLVTAGFVLVFGGATLILQDELFIKLKPTIINSMFAIALFVGLMMKRYFLRNVVGHAMKLQDEGWRQLTIRWIGFFIVLAILNEIVWRNFDTDAWVNFKVFGILPLTMLFTALQIPLFKRYFIEEKEVTADD